MIDTRMTSGPEQPVEALLRGELAHGDIVLATVGPILGHLLANDDHSLFNDEIIARIRGMIADCARQLLAAQADAAGAGDPSEMFSAHAEDICESLTETPAFLTHCHALAIEWHLANRLQSSNTVDAVLPPIVQALIGSPEPAVASNAMTFLAAQARFMQHQRRMELPLSELPGDLFHTAVLTLAAHCSEGAAEASKLAESALRGSYDEAKSRLGLLSRLVASMGNGALAALSIGHAGPSVFLTALSVASNQQRELAVIATNDRQLARLALGLRAAGLKADAIEQQFALIHPDVGLPGGFADLTSDSAAAILAASRPGLPG